jgi:hypothetical protein
MNEQQLSMVEGISSGIDKAITNLMNISMAKNKMKQDQDIFNLTKKQKELEIKKAEYTLDPEQLQLERNKLDAETKAQTALFNLRGVQIKTEETKQKKELETNMAGLNMIQEFKKRQSFIPEGTTMKIGQYAISRGKARSDSLSALLNDNKDDNNNPEVNEFLSRF